MHPQEVWWLIEQWSDQAEKGARIPRKEREEMLEMALEAKRMKEAGQWPPDPEVWASKWQH